MAALARARARSLFTAASPLVLVSPLKNGVSTLTMNAPLKLNAWTAPMLAALRVELAAASAEPACKVVVLTGTDPYYCAGVSLADTLKPMHPRALREYLRIMNCALFDTFLICACSDECSLARTVFGQ